MARSAPDLAPNLALSGIDCRSSLAADVAPAGETRRVLWKPAQKEISMLAARLI